MKKYLGTKLIEAEPCTLKDFNKIRPVYYSGKCKDGYKVKYEDGYVTWSPKDMFEKDFRRINNLTFGLAIEFSKLGKKVSRKGWNGKGMFVVYQKGYPQGVPCNKQTSEAWGLKEGVLFKCEPYLQIKMVNGSHAMWVPSINDVLAEDWEVVE